MSSNQLLDFSWWGLALQFASAVVITGFVAVALAAKIETSAPLAVSQLAVSWRRKLSRAASEPQIEDPNEVNQVVG